MIGASFTVAPRQRNTREENKMIKEGQRLNSKFKTQKILLILHKNILIIYETTNLFKTDFLRP